jgi:hypothetical protein
MSEQPKPVPTEQTKEDATLRARRLLVWVISFVAAVPATAILFYAFPAAFGKPPVPLNAELPISFVLVPLLPLTALPVGFLHLILLDAVMGTKILPD